MKIRIGYGLGTRTVTNEADGFGSFVDDLERLGFDSLWLSERINGEAPDPLIALAYAAARTKKLKFGTSVLVVPGRNPVLLAKELATLDRLSGGRMLPAFGLGQADPHEQQAFGVERGDRAKIFNEMVPLLRRFWTEDAVDHDGTWFHYEQMNVLPKPAHPLDVWLGGKAPAELRRVGRLSDGWLASFSSPQQCKEGRVVIEDAADAEGRSIDPEHFGVMVLYAPGEIPEFVQQVIANRNPDADINDLVARDWSGVRALCERHIAVGFSKLVLVPLSEPADWHDELATGAGDVLSLQT
jgi:probable F420-dependent oxidoreductase